MRLFPFVVTENDDRLTNWLVLLRKPGFVPPSGLEEAVKIGFEQRLIFDSVLIIALTPMNAMDLLLAEDVVRVVERVGTIAQHIVVVSVNQQGEIGSYASADTAAACDESKPDGGLVSAIYARALAGGISEIPIRTASTLVERAPSGRPFEKPSGKLCNYFIRAEAAYEDSDRTYFIALGVLQRIAEWQRVVPGATLRQLFIDSMAVYPIASAVAMLTSTLHVLGKPGSPPPIIPAIESFHSYSGLSAAYPITNASFCLISASSDGALAKAWMARHRAPAVSTVILFSFAPHAVTAPVLVTLIRPTDFTELPEVTGPTIRVVSEQFRMEQLPAKRVQITKEHYGQSQSASLLETVSSNAFRLGRSDEGGLTVGVEGLHTCAGFRLWFDSWLEALRLGQVGTLVTPNEQTKIRVQDILSGYGTALSVRTASEFLERPPDAVMPCAFVGLGENGDFPLFFEWIREIRRTQIRPALASAVTFFPSDEDRTRVRRTIKQICTHQPVWLEVVANFSPLSQYVERELVFWRRWDSDYARLRLAALNSFLRSEQLHGLFCVHDEAATLLPEFLGWPKHWVTNSIGQSGIALTIAAVLQFLRDGVGVQWDKRLKGALGEEVVICPSNFLERFNDASLVSALVRLARDSELDYSHDEESSRKVADCILPRLGSGFDSGKSGLDECLLAIATGRMKLLGSDLKRIASHAGLGSTPFQLAFETCHHEW